MIVPPVLRPLGDRLYYAPRQIKAYMDTNSLNTSQCYSGSYDHSLERKKRVEEMLVVPCSVFEGRIPFVQHRRNAGAHKCVEELKLGSSVFKTFVRDSEDGSKC